MKNQKENLWSVSVLVLCLLVASARAGAQTLPLSNIFTNTGATTGTNLWQYAASNHPTYYTSATSGDSRFFRGVFTPASSSAKLAIHSDDGSTVLINGQLYLSKAGVPTSLQDMAGSFNFLNYTFSNGVEYCVEVTYQNGQYTPGDQDGVTLYAYDGGGSARGGLRITGNDAVCVGNTLSLTADCGTPSFNWSSGNTSIATVNSSGVVTGVSSGSTSITVTDAESVSGSKTIYVVKPGISPSNVVTGVGVTNTFVLTNSAGSGTVTWNPQGTLSPNTRTNKIAFASPGTTSMTASYAGCSANANITAVAVASLTANVGDICGSAQVIYTAQSSPAGYESVLTWSGEGLSGTGAKRTNFYSTLGPHVVSVSSGTSVKSITNTVYKIDIAETTQTALADSTAPVTFSLTNSYGPATWQIGGSGPSFASQNTGNSVSINPGSNAGNFTITAYATALPGCTDTATLQVVKVAFSTNLVALCEGSTSSLTVTVTPSSAVSLLSFDTVTNTATGPSNTHASVTVNNGTNLTITGSAAGTAYLRAKLGNTVLIGPIIQIVRVTFPPEAWYVGVGNSRDFTATVLPANAAVIFDTASSAIATATPITGGLRVTGVGPGTTQVRAKVGGGAACATKDVTAVRVKFATNMVALCNGNSATVGVAIDPPGSPVSFAPSSASLLQVAVQGTNVTITSLNNGSGLVNASVGNVITDWLVAWSLTVRFPASEWFVPLGGSQFFTVLVDPPFFSPQVDFTSSDTNIGTVTAAGYPLRAAVFGKTNASAQILASVGMGQPCGAKNFTVFHFDNLRFQKATMTGAWKNIDQSYKFLGVFTGQTATFGIVTTPAGLALPSDAVRWSGAASGSSTQVNVTFPKAGSAQIIATIGTVAKSTSAEVFDQPAGTGENAYALGHPFQTATAIYRNLAGLNPLTLEPFVWASTNYPGLQPQNTIADAARHAYWTCLLTRYTDASYAKGITTAHEVSMLGPSTETVMDLHNNSIGIVISSNHTHGVDNACCQAAVVIAVNTGLLWYLDGSYGATDTNEGTLLQPTNK